MHSQFLNIDGKKISKSAGDDLSLPGLEKRWYDPLDLRYFFLTAHYRSFQDFTWEHLDAAKNTRKNLKKKVNTWINEIENAEIDKRIKRHLSGIEFADTSVSYQDFLEWSKNRLSALKETLQEFPIDEKYLPETDRLFWQLYDQFDTMVSPLLDDLNMPELLGNLNGVEWRLEKLISLVDDSLFPRYHVKYFTLLFFKYFEDNIFKIWLFDAAEELIIPAEIIALAQERVEAKKNKDYKLADMIRENLAKQGRYIEDTPSGFKITR